MVKQIFTYVAGASFFIMPHFSMADTYQQYQQAVDNGQSTIDKSKQLLRYDQLDQYIQSPNSPGNDTGPKKAPGQDDKSGNDGKPGTQKDAPAGGQPGQPEKTNKQSGDSTTNSKSSAAPTKPGQEGKKSAKTNEGHKESAKKPRRRIRHGDNGIYIAPSLSSGPGGMDAISNNTPDIQMPKRRNIIFGIRIGTEIPVKLVGGASNVQPGYMKFRVTQTITGDKRSLPVNTYLFAMPSAVIGSPRLFARGQMTGITPGGKEFTIKATIQGSDQQPGLLAYVVNDGKTLYRAADAGKAALGEGLISLTGQGVVQDAAKASAGQLLNEQRKESQAKYGQDAYVVQSNPQTATIEIEETF